MSEPMLGKLAVRFADWILYSGITMPTATCGNPQHPNGPWHPAGCVEMGWKARLRDTLRREQWGCECPLQQRFQPCCSAPIIDGMDTLHFEGCPEEQRRFSDRLDALARDEPHEREPVAPAPPANFGDWGVMRSELQRLWQQIRDADYEGVSAILDIEAARLALAYERAAEGRKS